jgi:hypothetical protein
MIRNIPNDFTYFVTKGGVLASFGGLGYMYFMQFRSRPKWHKNGNFGKHAD